MSLANLRRQLANSAKLESNVRQIHQVKTKQEAYCEVVLGHLIIRLNFSKEFLELEWRFWLKPRIDKYECQVKYTTNSHLLWQS